MDNHMDNPMDNPMPISDELFLDFTREVARLSKHYFPTDAVIRLDVDCGDDEFSSMICHKDSLSEDEREWVENNLTP